MYTTNKITTINKTIDNLVIDSLFLDTPNTLNESDVRRLVKNHSIRYDLGKYSVAQKNTANMGIFPIWYTLKTDNNGKYIALHCIDDDNLNLTDRAVYNHIVAVFKNNVK
tara:strand:+ start:451 stop:780 length:330 start_codon:yes stop_codon:yes gene_type:complete